MTQEPNATPAHDNQDLHGSAAAAEVLAHIQEVDTVVGLLAYAELAAQMRLAIDASRAPNARFRMAQADLSAAAHRRMRALISLLNERGTDGEAQVRAFNNAFDDYEQRTKAETWHERVLKGYVGHSVAVDFCRILIQALPADIRERVDESLSSSDETVVASDILTHSAQEDSVLASRLALWGRRLVGEALNQIQGLVLQYPALASVLAQVAAEQGVEVEGEGAEATAKLVTSWLFAQLTADHARRMDRIGLAS